MHSPHHRRRRRFDKVSSRAASPDSSSARVNPDSATKTDLSRDSSPRTNLSEGQEEELGPVIAKVLLLRNNGHRRFRPSMEKIEKMRNVGAIQRRYLPVHILSTGLKSAPSARLAVPDADYEASRSVIISEQLLDPPTSDFYCCRYQNMEGKFGISITLIF